MARVAVVASLVIGLAGVGLTQAGCDSSASVVRIGYKDFDEQLILAHAIRDLLERSGVRTRLSPCIDTFGCQQSLRRGELDLMVEYTGTGLLYVGHSGHLGAGAQGGAAPAARAELDVLRKLYRPLGLDWLEPLGFGNGYVLVMKPSRARALGIHTIADLGNHPRALRFAIPSSYLSRPSDGYPSLLARHGIIARADPLVEPSSTERIDAVLSGRVDVAVAYETDSALMGLDLTVLDDSLHFFPTYRAAVVVRIAAASAHPDLGQALAPLAGSIDTATMRELNYGAGTLGIGADALAERLLIEVGSAPATPHSDVPPLRLAVAKSDDLSSETELALHMLRQAFPRRALEPTPTGDPLRDVERGHARLALVGAERLFQSPGGARVGVRGVEAIAVVDERVVHVLRRTGSSGGLSASARVGINPTSSGSGRVGAEILAALGKQPELTGTTNELLASLSAGAIDAAIVLTGAGDPVVGDALSAGAVELAPLSEPEVRAALPQLQPSRIPPSTYPGLSAPVETLHSQVVLVGPAPLHRARSGMGPGPNTNLDTSAGPVPQDRARALVAASEAKQIPDAVLPSIWSRVSTSRVTGLRAHELPRWLDTGLNLIVLAFLGWLITITLRRDS